MAFDETFRAARAQLSGLLFAARQGSLQQWATRKADLGLDELLPINVHGVGLGYRWRDGRPTREPCIQVTVLRKLPPELFDTPLGRVWRIDREIMGVPIDIVEADPVVVDPQFAPATANLLGSSRVRPLQPGCQISIKNTLYGTLGAAVRSTAATDAGRTMLLTCRHVVAPGDTDVPGTAVQQPGDPARTTSDERDRVGSVTRFSPNYPIGSPGHNHYDAAVAELDEGIATLPEPAGIGPLQGLLDIEAVQTRDLLDEPFCKSGCRTGVTVGVGAVLEYDAVVLHMGRDRFFENQFRVVRAEDDGAPLSRKGDSGSIVIHQPSRRAAGLLIGGSTDGRYMLASSIVRVCAGLEVELVW